MKKLVLAASATLALCAFASPASAQYVFDKTVDPINCHWTDICDYGGRAIIGYRARRVAYDPLPCRTVSVRHVLPDGSVVFDRERRCAVRVKG